MAANVLTRRSGGFALFHNSLLRATLILVALTVVVTWPQALHLATAVPDHDDPFFSMWRLGWLAHALPANPRYLFDGNIFHPHNLTLAYGDATLLEGLLASPWLWAGANLVLIYNLLLLTGIVSSGLGMFVLVRRLTNDADAALVSAALFSLAPYRIEHFMHLELQWTVWIPLTFWAIHRVFDHPIMWRGVLAGMLLALEVLSSLYYGVFLGMIVPGLIVLLAARRPRQARAAMAPLCVGAVLAACVLAVYAVPYFESAQVVGTRDRGETARYSAQIASYFTAPQHNWLWGWTSVRFEGNERHLFPTIVAVVLAVVAITKSTRRHFVWVYLALTILAIDLSLGLNGVVYRWLHQHIWLFQGFRAPARFAILAVCGLAILAGFGYEHVKRYVGKSALPLITVLVAIAVECASVPLRLVEVPRQAPDIYVFLGKSLPTDDRSVTIEFPMESGFSPLYMFWSTRHWHPLVNGYSGFTPPDYEETRTCMRTFPDGRSIARLRQLNVKYILVHQAYYSQKERTALLLAAARSPDLIPAGQYRDWIAMTQVFELRPVADPIDGGGEHQH